MCVCGFFSVYFTSGHSVGYFLCFIEATRMWNMNMNRGLWCCEVRSQSGRHFMSSVSQKKEREREISFLWCGLILPISFLRTWKKESKVILITAPRADRKSHLTVPDDSVNHNKLYFIPQVSWLEASESINQSLITMVLRGGI